MRYLDEVTFIEKSKGDRYDPDLGEWVEEEPIKTLTLANVTDLGSERSIALFGSFKQGAKVIRTQPLFYVPNFNHVEINDIEYVLTKGIKPQDRTSLIVEEFVDG